LTSNNYTLIAVLPHATRGGSDDPGYNQDSADTTVRLYPKVKTQQRRKGICVFNSFCLTENLKDASAVFKDFPKERQKRNDGSKNRKTGGQAQPALGEIGM
jgi:hypothetical protein